ncbi:hypothetical protein [Burkholderia cepacia]|uniref:Uncharacterized protein n=1 Tax=Burkholderia cepacia TaxID=292 RepID=A0ABM6NVH6_BURCE|nr:hypothetical protein [Burkholderia cepacia]AIO25339.1 hypothetical protein DM41_2887 [Burkholderia cepacia ATCC 25416]ALK18439.1 hypothetical protein APZ15_11835 [Burkholderia cepacia ATCC 25416]ASE96089.1 hypothetical protein CEQ23_22470 [Burkholderia cepacia]ATF78910.1 hypothetical protein CO711_16795 [Burkholderia cepacia]MCA8466960.1 hypothetical protein [Burkholderia cepacia]
MKALTAMQRLIREGTQVEQTSDVEVSGYWRGHHIWIRRSEQLCDGAWYIQVRHSDGGYLYDGWWGSAQTTPEEAVAEAFRGACLLEEE